MPYFTSISDIELGQRVLISRDTAKRFFKWEDYSRGLVFKVTSFSSYFVELSLAERPGHTFSFQARELMSYESTPSCQACEEVTLPERYCYYCKSCLQCCADNGAVCEGCGWHYCSTDQGDFCITCSDGGNSYCESCCGGHSYCSSCEYECVVENYYCTSCNACSSSCCNCDTDDTEHGNLHGYSTNVLDHLSSQVPLGVRTYGIELEVVAKDRSSYADVLNAMGDMRIRKNWVAKEDGSLPTYGIEIVSAPLTMTELMDAVKELFEVAKLERHLIRSSDAGTHIHVGRKNVSARTISRTWFAWYWSSRGYSVSDGETIEKRQITLQRRNTMCEVLRALAGRSQTGYCNWGAQAPVNMETGRAYLNGHYAAISASDHYDTYEFRMFSGVTKLRTALRYIETLDLLLSIGEETHGVDVMTNPNTLLAEIGARIEAYPALWESVCSPALRLSAYHSILDAHRKGTPRKKRAKSIRTGIDAAANVRHYLETSGVARRASRDAQRYLDRIERNVKQRTGALA